MKVEYSVSEIKELLLKNGMLEDKKKLLPIPEGQKEEILTNPIYAQYLKEMREKGEEYRNKPLTSLPFSSFKLFEITGDRDTFQAPYFEHRGRLTTFALLVWLYEREEDISALEDIIWAICDEYTWSLPAHLGGKGLSHLEPESYMIDLFAAETGGALAEILTLDGAFLSEIVKKRMLYCIQERTIQRFLMTEEHEEFGWQTCHNNWGAVCAGAVGMAALYASPDPETAARIISLLQKTMDYYLASFPEDGTSLEGVTYWGYGYSFFASYADLLERATGGVMNWFEDPRAHVVATFPQKAFVEGPHFICFADCAPSMGGDVSCWWGLTCFLKEKYSDVESLPRERFYRFDGDRCFRWCRTLRNISWGRAEVEPAERAEGSCLLPQAQWLICNGGHRTSLAAKGGHNAESHNHNDVGSLELFRGGEEILADVGSAVYTRQYFRTETRYTQYFEPSSFAHSVPIVENCPQMWGAECRAENVSMGEWYLDLELQKAYPQCENLKKLHRRIEFEPEEGKTTVQDHFEFYEGSEGLAERFVSYGKPVEQKDFEGKKQILLQGVKSSVVLQYDPRLNFSWETHDYARSTQEHPVVYLLDFYAPAGETSYDYTFILK